MFEFRLLGPVEVWVGTHRVDAGMPRQRTVLAAMLADVGHVISTDAMVDRVWGDAPPQRARHSLYSHIARIRRLIAEIPVDGANPPRLTRRSGGYLLDADPDQVDLHRARHLVARSRQKSSNNMKRARYLREAVGLWRGDPLTGLDGQWAARMRESWRRERLETAVAWARAELRINNPSTLIGPLTELVGEHPLVESLTSVLMQALAASGRAAEALETYGRIRQRLSEELGTDPYGELQAVHRAILRGKS